MDLSGFDTHAKTRIVDNGDIDSIDRKKVNGDLDEPPRDCHLSLHFLTWFATGAGSLSPIIQVRNLQIPAWTAKPMKSHQILIPHMQSMAAVWLAAKRLPAPMPVRR